MVFCVQCGVRAAVPPRSVCVRCLLRRPGVLGRPARVWGGRRGSRSRRARLAALRAAWFARRAAAARSVRVRAAARARLRALLWVAVWVAVGVALRVWWLVLFGA